MLNFFLCANNTFYFARMNEWVATAPGAHLRIKKNRTSLRKNKLHISRHNISKGFRTFIHIFNHLCWSVIVKWVREMNTVIRKLNQPVNWRLITVNKSRPGYRATCSDTTRQLGTAGDNGRYATYWKWWSLAPVHGWVSAKSEICQHEAEFSAPLVRFRALLKTGRAIRFSPLRVVTFLASENSTVRESSCLVLLLQMKIANLHIIW